MTTVEEISELTRPHHPDDWTELDSAAVDTVRVLAADAVQKVGNGHPGTAMSLAPLAYTLFQRQMRHDPSDTHWVGRDRFILSAGHSSLTQYVQLYLTGFGLELDDVKKLRTAGSLTPGHPEYGHTNGVEITTGPLGSGLASKDGRQVNAQARIAFKNVKGNTVVANYQWRSCADHAKQCAKGDLSGDGWSDKERILFITDGATLIGVEDEAQWLGRVNANGSVTLIFSEMQNDRPQITPLIIAYQLTKVS